MCHFVGLTQKDPTLRFWVKAFQNQNIKKPLNQDEHVSIKGTGGNGSCEHYLLPHLCPTHKLVSENNKVGLLKIKFGSGFQLLNMF